MNLNNFEGIIIKKNLKILKMSIQRMKTLECGAIDLTQTVKKKKMNK